MSDPQGSPLFPIKHSPYLPPNAGIESYNVYPYWGAFASPWEFTGWREEITSWYSGVGIHVGLNPTPTSVLTGPDVLRFLSDTAVNGFEMFPVGSAKHVIMCNDEGNVMVHGLALRVSEDAVSTMWLEPWLSYLLGREPGKYDVQVTDHTDDTFLLQLGGPHSLSVLEAASGDNLHDIRFARHRLSTIAGTEVTILRIGMAGTLAYEVHGPLDQAVAVYEAIHAAGQEFKIKQMGIHAYMLSHTQNGFPQSGLHFPLAWTEDDGFMEYVGGIDQNPFFARGSADPDRTGRYRNPVELGWGHMINLKHDFIGKKALETELAAPKRTMVTLEWNNDDIVDIHASQLTAEPYLPMDQPGHMEFWPAVGESDFINQSPAAWGDDVQNASGEIVGMSSGRIFSEPFRRVISLASINTADARQGDELVVIWGDPGTRQKKVRVTIACFPYLVEGRNEDVDVSTIPVHPAALAASATALAH